MKELVVKLLTKKSSRNAKAAEKIMLSNADAGAPWGGL